MTTPHSITPFSADLSPQKRELLDRLFSRPRADLATPALEQLFATRLPNEISASEVSALLAEYGVRGRDAQAVCESVWRKAFVAFVQDDVLEPAEVEYLFALRRPLGISEQFVQQVEADVSQARYRERAARALADATVTPEEREELERLGRGLRIDPAVQRHIFQDEARKVVEQVAREMATDRRITPEEQERLRTLLQEFGVELDAATAERVETYILSWHLEHGGPLPVTKADIPLEDGELCHLQVAAEWREQRGRRRGGQALDAPAPIDSGTLYVTNRRVIFQGETKKASFPYDSLRDVKSDTDAVLLDRRSGRSPYFVPPADRAEFVARVALAAFQRFARDATQPAPGAAPESPPPGRLPMAYLLAELDKLVGLEPVKRELTHLTNLLRVRKLREEQGLSMPPISLHMVFAGNPGTGKTTVARLLGSIYQTLGVLPTGQLVETDPAALLGARAGQLEPAAGDVVRSAAGGLLLVDEARVADSASAEATLDREAADTLLALTSDERGDPVVIVAGQRDVTAAILEANPQLKSRFSRVIEFPDYAPAELLQIFTAMVEQAEYRLTREARTAAELLFRAAHAAPDTTIANARLVRHVFERTIARHSDRVATLPEPTRDELSTILPGDLPIGEPLG